MTRFDDGGRALVQFTDRVAVRCPRCAARATVTRGTDRAPAKVVCSSCSYAVSFDEAGWLGPMRGIARRRCGTCGQWVERRFGGPRPPKVAHLVCTCGWGFDEDVTTQQETRGPVDPVFGLALWFTAPFKREVVWAYNLEHVRFLREYIDADLRERIPNRNSSLASRLPAWMKAAKNRDALVAILDGLDASAVDDGEEARRPAPHRTRGDP
jgi:hypothetical protein